MSDFTNHENDDPPEDPAPHYIMRQIIHELGRDRPRVEHIFDRAHFAHQVKKLFELVSKDICARSGALSQFMYASPEGSGDMVDGAGGFNDLCNYSPYYLRDAEKDLILKENSSIAAFLADRESIIDLGPGPKESVLKKTIPVVEALQRHSEKTIDLPFSVLSGTDCQSYAAVDISRAYLQGAAEVMMAGFRQKSLTPLIYTLNQDFAKVRDELKPFSNPGFLFLGNTVSNFPSSQSVPNPGARNFLLTIRLLRGNADSKIVIGGDCNQNEQSLLAAYNNDFAAQWMKNLLHRMMRDAGVIFEPALNNEATNWDYFARWNKKAYCMEMGVKSLKDHSVSMRTPDGLKYYTLKQGAELHMWNSFKYPQSVFAGMLKSTGFELEQILHNPDDPGRRVALYLCRMPKLSSEAYEKLIRLKQIFTHGPKKGSPKFIHLPDQPVSPVLPVPAPSCAFFPEMPRIGLIPALHV